MKSEKVAASINNLAEVAAKYAHAVIERNKTIKLLQTRVMRLHTLLFLQGVQLRKLSQDTARHGEAVRVALASPAGEWEQAYSTWRKQRGF